jgi:5-oxoprolinase (ATP-hydrolysing)
MSEDKHFRLGVDVGGTYTDLVLLDEQTNKMKGLKVPSTPSDMTIGVMRGIEELGVPLASVRYIVHGATVGVNTIIQKRGDKTGLLSTKGFIDVLEIGDMAKPDMYNLFFQKARPLISREDSLPINERVSALGEILNPVQDVDVHQQVQKLKKQGVTSIAVCMLNSFVNPENEERIAQIIEREFPELDVSVSNRIVRQRNEIYRASTVAVNAYIAPPLRRYLTSLEEKLKAKGFQGVLFIMSSSGGLMTSDRTKKMPVYTLLSGPVGGSIGGRAFGAETGLKDVITFDMGGTSCDISVIVGGVPDITHEARVEGYQVMTPMVKVSYLGAGGGSIARVVGETSLRVGPESAGADPGPACYGTGGTQPTVTDANLVLGRLDPKSPLAGGITLRADLARKAIKEHVADKLGLSVEKAALGIIKIVCNRMAYVIREVTVQQGLDPREFTLVSFGGAGAMHVPFLAQTVGIKKIVVPPSPGTFCAWGMLNTDVRHDLVMTVDYAGRKLSLKELTNAFRDLEAEGRAAIQAEGVADKDIYRVRSVDMRYRGQDHTLTVQISNSQLDETSILEARKLFDETHLRKYGHNSPGEEIEFINIRLEVGGRMQKPGLYRVPEHAATAGTYENPKSALLERRMVTFQEGTFDTPVYARNKMQPGTSFSGPAIVFEDGATTVLPPHFQMQVDAYGNLVIDIPTLRAEKVALADSDELDPITVEVIWNALVAAAEEMSLNIQRSAHNWIITKGKDHSTGIYGPNAETYAQAQGLPEFVCDMPTAIQSIIKDLGGLEAFREGDLYLTNDPYANTLHVHDVNAIKPVFYKGQVIAFCGARVHWHDIGGAVRAGSMTATEVFQEGLILRTIKIMDASGQMDRNVVSIIRENNRIPDHTIGDLKAQVGACIVGERRLMEVLEKYGLEAFRKSVARILRNGEQQALDVLKQIPEGEYEAQSCLDNDGVDLDKPLPIKVKITVKDETMTFDLSGSAEGCRGPMHCNTNTTGSICRMIYKMLTTPREPANEGHFRAVKVVIPEKSMFRAKKPEATLPGFFALEALIDCAKRALAPAIPHLVNADDYGKCTPAHIAFLREDGEYLFLPDTEGGGWGAKPYEDGENALLFGACPIVSTEDHEAKFPVRLAQYVLRQDSGGPGRYRGGLGIVKDYQALTDCTFNAGLDRQVCPPQGVLGGGSAFGQRLVIKKPDGTELLLPSKVSAYPVKKGEIISFQTAGGGGYGNPLERDLKLIEADLKKGLISPEYAEKHHGVSADRNTLHVTRVRSVGA